MNAGRFLSWLVVLVSLPVSVPASTEVRLGSDTPIYQMRNYSRTGVSEIRLRVNPEVRSVDFRFTGNRNLPVERNKPVSVELRYSEPRADQPDVVFTGQVIPNPDPVDPKGLFRVFLAKVVLTPRTVEGIWVLKLRSLPLKTGEDVDPLDITVRIESDARPITQREKALMEWRSKVDPAQDPEAVRAKIAQLTDEEVRYYTGFKSRENFLAVWGHKTYMDYLTPDGKGVTLTDENEDYSR
jgi:hypothetical protein